jgi:hypothetical protein
MVISKAKLTAISILSRLNETTSNTKKEALHGKICFDSDRSFALFIDLLRSCPLRPSQKREVANEKKAAHYFDKRLGIDANYDNCRLCLFHWRRKCFLAKGNNSSKSIIQFDRDRHDTFRIRSEVLGIQGLGAQLVAEAQSLP